MPIVVIQSVFSRAQLLLLDSQGSLLDETHWISKKDEIRQIIPRLEKLLRVNKTECREITGIVSVVGVGNFSATRIGVTIANVLALAAGAELRELRLEAEVSSKDLQTLTLDKLKKQWPAVKVAKPVYGAQPMISKSKKPIF